MCLTTTKYGVNPKIPHPNKRPHCSVKGCKSPRAIISVLKDGTPSYRKICDNHHKEVIAKRKGFETITEYSNSVHPYRKYRKDYCENVDARLGFTCTTTIVHMVQLDVDHKDGNHLNNKVKNLQTLCKCCHSYKGLIYEDYKTPGRKTRAKAAA